MLRVVLMLIVLRDFLMSGVIFFIYLVLVMCSVIVRLEILVFVSSFFVFFGL